MNGPEAFWSNVDQSAGPAGCWPWLRSRNRRRGDYGQVKWEGRVQTTHRVAYSLAVGPIPDGLTLDHVRTRGCSGGSCCNPAHLEPVTLAENIARTAGETCGRGHPKTPEHGRIRSGNKWRCVTCETSNQRVRREMRRK